jgi:hypothetical protein
MALLDLEDDSLDRLELFLGEVDDEAHTDVVEPWRVSIGAERGAGLAVK